MSSNLEEQREEITQWVDDIRQRFRVEIPEIGKRARLSNSTIYRWYDTSRAFNASRTSLKKIADAFDVAMPGAKTARAIGFEEGDATPYDVEVEEFGPLTADQSVWRMSTRALELIGYLPDDILLVDMKVPPRSGDVVVAQIYDLERGSAQTRVRQYKAPYILTRTLDLECDERPLLVDDDRVKIAGTVVRMLRLRY